MNFLGINIEQRSVKEKKFIFSKFFALKRKVLINEHRMVKHDIILGRRRYDKNLKT